MRISRLLVVISTAVSAAAACQPTRQAPEVALSDALPPPPSTESSAIALEPPSTTPAVDRSECGLPETLREPHWPRTLSPTTSREPSPFEPGAFTIAVLPDTQYYASCRESHFPEQGRWLRAQVEARSIIGAIHLGDLTEHNTADEWEYVSGALSPLFDKIPLFLATGNHDYGDDGTANERKTLFAEFFGTPKESTAPHVAATMRDGDVENAYYRIPTRNSTLGILVLEWSPTDAAVAWAKKTVALFPDDRKIFVTHAYLFHDGTRYDFAEKGDEQPWNPLTYGTAKLDPEMPYSKVNAIAVGAHDGAMLWNDLLKDLPGLFLTLSGHVLGDGAGVLTSVGHGGAKVHQVLTNFQMLDEGGLGYLRLIEISPDGASMKMKTYSPSLDRFATAEAQNFSLSIDPPLL